MNKIVLINSGLAKIALEPIRKVIWKTNWFVNLKTHMPADSRTGS